jgi:hypothetical protein
MEMKMTTEKRRTWVALANTLLVVFILALTLTSGVTFAKSEYPDNILHRILLEQPDGSIITIHIYDDGLQRFATIVREDGEYVVNLDENGTYNYVTYNDVDSHRDVNLDYFSPSQTLATPASDNPPADALTPRRIYSISVF